MQDLRVRAKVAEPKVKLKTLIRFRGMCRSV